MIEKKKTLKEWAEENPTVNPFTNCLNIATYGGADLLYSEFLYRYRQREIFDEDNFVFAVKRVFVINEYKYERLHQTTTLSYNPLNNYRVQKSGTETNSLSSSRTDTGSSTRSPNLKEHRTPNITETTTPSLTKTETFTPTIKSKETITPTVKTKETVTPTVKTKETETPGVSTTTETTPESYTDTTSRSTYDDLTFKAVEEKDHVGNEGGTSTVSHEGYNEKITEVLEGDTETVTEVVSGDTQRVTETLGGTNETVTSTTGSSSVATTGTELRTTSGTESVTTGLTRTENGSDTLSFTNRVDEGYMYREPQNAIKDEREIADFALINIILSDVEAMTLLSIYLN